MAFTFNPPIDLPAAVVLALIFFTCAMWLARRATAGTRMLIRFPLLGLRGTGLLLIVAFWLNPGQWLTESRNTRRDWLVLVDRSNSMTAEHAERTSRWDAATTAARVLAKASGKDGDVHVHTFAAQLEDELEPDIQLPVDGNATDIGRAVSAAMDQKGAALGGLVVVSDGRETTKSKIEELALRARGLGIPIHVIPVGGSWGSRDLALTAVPRQITAFRGQPVKLNAQVENRGLGAIKPTITLHGPDGNELSRQTATLTEGARQTITFDLPNVPENGGEYRLGTAPWPGEHLPANNIETVRVNVLASRTRVLLLEGAPYWDSKFLAQLLRQQSAIEILTVHRLNEERYFRVEATGAEPLLNPETVFPESAEALARYDLIVFGKGADGFLTPARAAALQGFVRDQGGAVLFARGKPYAGRFPALEALEPVDWGESLSGSMQFTPVADAAANLFGSALPSADDKVWATLPPLEDIYSIARLRPFSRVLAEGTVEGRQTRLPLLIARRFGRGMVAAVNADGLWRWDFRPEIREKGALYQQFWVQLMQWCATYSEFRPGQDYAVRLRETSSEPGQAVRAVIAYRGNATQPRPVLKISRNGQPAGEAVATQLPGTDGGREWAAVITPDQPGRYEIRVADPGRPNVEEGEATLAVMAPPTENDDLRPNLDILFTLARASGGQVFTPEEADKLAGMLWSHQAIAEQDKPRWEPLWPQWWVAMFVALTFGGEWWIRRREGLL